MQLAMHVRCSHLDPSFDDADDADEAGEPRFTPLATIFYTTPTYLGANVPQRQDKSSVDDSARDGPANP